MFGNRARDANESAQGAEERSDYRAEMSGITAMISTSRGEVVANIHNLSTRGLMASAAEPPLVGDRIVVSLDSLAPVHGQVRWVKGNRFGILLFGALPIGAFRLADQGRGRRPRPPRHVVRVPARIEAPGIARGVTIQNISYHGMQLETGLPINPGKLLTIIVDGQPPMEGRVRWSRGSRCGVLLSEAMEPEMFEAIAQRK